MERNVSGQFIQLFVFDYSTGAPKTGDASNLTFYVAPDGDTSPNALGDTSATELSSTNAPGWYQCDLTQAETNFINALFSGKSSTGNVSVVGRVVSTTPAGFSTFVTPTNLTAAQIATGVWQDATAGDFTTASSIGKALYIANVAPGGSGGHLISGSNSGTTTFGALTVTGATTLSGAVSFGSTFAVTGTSTFAAINTGAIGTGTVTVTGNVSVSGTTTLTGAVTATNGANAITGVTAVVTGTVTVGTNNDKTGYSLVSGYDAAKTAAQAGDAMTLTAGAVTAIWAYVVTGSTTAVQMMRGFAAAMLGKASGLPTTPKYRDVADTKDVITATATTDGNRTAVTLDLT